MTGWPDKQITPEITLYFSKHHEITVKDGSLLWGIQAIIPTQLHVCALGHQKSHCILANITKLQLKVVVYCGKFKQ